jgi:linoleoyl-CoA desaturase
MNPDDSTKNVWYIHGKRYDLTAFLDKHPGGRTILESCKNDNDCTAAFESYHSMCNMNQISSIMKKYEINDLDNCSIQIQPKYSFNDDGFYRTVQKRVRDHFNKDSLDSNTLSHHSNLFFWIKTGCFMMIYFVFAYIAFFSRYDSMVRTVNAFFAGSSVVWIAYNILHDASHCAIASNNWINNTLSQIMCSYFLWDHQLWAKHHVYRHHAFTNDPVLDPDTMHLRPFVKKHPADKERKFIKLFRKYPKITTLVSMIIFPGSYVGQGLLYHFVWLVRKYLWGMRLPETYRFSLFETIIKLFKLYVLFQSGSIAVIIAYLVAINMSYFFTIIPDHDMKQTAENHRSIEINENQGSEDWGEVQVRSSGNYATSNPWVSEMYGGINYQIEHHLFPTICNVHYRDISKIVKNTCKEYTIPYVETDTVYDAVNSVLQNFSSIEIKD